MAYSAGEDGALKFWDLAKVAETMTPKFERTIAVLDRVITGCGPTPESSVAITTYSQPRDRFAIQYV